MLYSRIDLPVAAAVRRIDVYETGVSTTVQGALRFHSCIPHVKLVNIEMPAVSAYLRKTLCGVVQELRYKVCRELPDLNRGQRLHGGRDKGLER